MRVGYNFLTIDSSWGLGGRGGIFVFYGYILKELLGLDQLLLSIAVHC